MSCRIRRLVLLRLRNDLLGRCRGEVIEAYSGRRDPQSGKGQARTN